MKLEGHYNLTGTLIGYQYPFFLGNTKLSDSYYLYQITTPALSPNTVPYLSMTKISEKTKSDPSGKGSDILSVCLGSRKNIQETGVKFMQTVVKKEETSVVGNGKEFPWVEMTLGNNLQKTMIVCLRDALRWKAYKFTPGHYIDLLWTIKDFLVFKIVGDGKDSIWLEPVSAYRNTDVEMKNPIPVDWTRINFPKEHFTGFAKASDLNRTLKRLEWGCFDRRPFRI
jgi:hypothetical protein